MRQIYVNLPVKDVQRSRRFFGALGFQFDEQFSNEDAACVVFNETLHLDDPNGQRAGGEVRIRQLGHRSRG